MTIYYVLQDSLIPESEVNEWRKSDPDTIAVVTVSDHDARVEDVYQQTLFDPEGR